VFNHLKIYGSVSQMNISFYIRLMVISNLFLWRTIFSEEIVINRGHNLINVIASPNDFYERIAEEPNMRNRSWCSSSRDNDQRAVIIECASDLTEPYAMKPEVYSALVELCTDICRRNGKRKLVWISDRDKALAYSVKSDEMLLTVHRWFAKKSCPGNWLMERLGSLADEVNHKISLSD